MSFEKIKFNDNFLFGKSGVLPSQLESLADRLDKCREWLLELHQKKKLSFLDLPFKEDALSSLQKLVDTIDFSIKDVVVLGIGGSSLGPKAIYSALKPPYYNLNNQVRRVHFPDNVDPSSFKALLDYLDPSQTLFLVITKSGGTAETATQFMIVWDYLNSHFDKKQAIEHLIAVTDPEKGSLRALVNEYGLKNCSIPQNVGGRFSVLSPVGLLPTILAELDAEQLLAGARDMANSFRQGDVNHMTLRAAGLYYLLHLENKCPIHVLMPYSDALYDTALWFNQLWGESLGKRKNLQGEDIFVGPTPVAARGATDQHSQLQLFVEGPQDKIITFLEVSDSGNDLEIPPVFGNYDSYSYLAGHTMGELLKTELAATSLALNKAGRPNCSLILEKTDAYNLGQLFMFYQITTAISGKLYNINPFNQPGVEQGKQYTYGAFGRRGFETEGKVMSKFKTDFAKK
ncbi:MAG: glucose-6-phosphate isomerase [Myxococcota bacterium]